MKKVHAIFVWTVILAVLGFVSASDARQSAPESKPTAPKVGGPPATTQNARSSTEYSGMYSFLKDGEFVQITVEDDGRLTGFVSRYGDAETDKGAFLDQYFRGGKLDGNKLSFTTQTVQAMWFAFNGTVERGEGKNPGDEAYYVLKGTLTDNTTDASKKVTTHSQDVVLKMFPRN
jgi:hypothetical protein